MNFDTPIWILEADPEYRQIYGDILAHRYSLRFFQTLSDFRNALEKPGAHPPSLVLSELRLPEQSFLSFLGAEFAKINRTWPLIVITSVDDIDAVRLSLDAGAVDYITKPFGKHELAVKIERFLIQSQPGDIPRRCEIDIDLTTLTVIHRNQVSASLTSKELQIVAFLRDGQSVSRADIVAHIWGGITVSPKTFDVHLVNLRRKLILLDLEVQYIAPFNYQLVALPFREQSRLLEAPPKSPTLRSAPG